MQKEKMNERKFSLAKSSSYIINVRRFVTQRREEERNNGGSLEICETDNLTSHI